MKKYFIYLLLLIPINCYTQIYNKKGEMKFKVVHYISEYNSVEDTLNLILHGELWKIPSKNESGFIFITQENNWSIDWVSSTGKEGTGILENDSLLFMHPPRHSQYAILEYCPFPQIQFPLYVGESWNFNLKVGEIWLKAIKRKAEGKTIVQSNYSVTGKISWYCPFLKKNIDCYEIKATANTKFGNTSLQAYFSEIYGFVYLGYATLNDDRFVFTLRSITTDTPLFQNKAWF